MTHTRFGLATALLISALACNGESSSPTAPTATRIEPTGIQALVVRAAADPSGFAMERALSSVFDASSRPMVITFPPRNEPMEFRAALEAKYRDGLRRSSVQTYVDQEGTVVWTQEYLRYRVNFCSHADAVSRVMGQIDGQGIAAMCGKQTLPAKPSLRCTQPRSSRRLLTISRITETKSSRGKGGTGSGGTGQKT